MSNMAAIKHFFSCGPCSKNGDLEDEERDLNPIDATPTAGEYVGVAAKEFLTLLESVAGEVPVPGFDAAVKLASNIIRACDDSQANLARAKDLQVRIKTLVAVFVNELKGKKEAEIHARLLEDIKTLQMDLDHIKQILDKITSQNRLLLVFFRSLNNDKVEECVSMMNKSLERFNLSRTINFTNFLTTLEQEIRSFHAQQQEALRALQLTMNDVKAILDQRLLAAAGVMLSLSRAPIPANSAIFHGRDELVAELVEIIMDRTQPKHVCILGTGGMGKTSTALAVMARPGITARFPNDLRVWVPCIKATSVSLFLDTLHSSLAVLKRKGDVRADILTELKMSQPIILLLDNFETPWNVQGAQSDVEHILRDIGQFPHVTIFVTMKSSTAPCGDLPWHCINLQAVDEMASRRIYTSWCPEGLGDPNLSRLLNTIGHMPLAVVLMAKIAHLTGLDAEELVNRFEKVGPSVMDLGSDAESNMNACISVSVNSPRMKDHPSAFDLLCTLSMLPTGTSYDMLSKWWAKDIANMPVALGVLKNTSLVEQRGSIYFVLPVIQHFILHHSRFNVCVRTSMIESACAFLQQHESKIGDPLYIEHVAAISAEEGNLEAVLLQVTTPDPHRLRHGHLLLARYQEYNRPRVDVVEHALRLMPDVDDEPLHGDLLYSYGDIFYWLGQHKEALIQFEAAFTLYDYLADTGKAAETRLAITEASSFLSNGNSSSLKQLIQTSQGEYESIHDKAGIGRCLHHFGYLELSYGSNLAAIDYFKRAEAALADTNDRYWHAVCTRFYALAYYRVADYDNAFLSATFALQESEDIGQRSGCWVTADLLGKIACGRGDYKGSLQHFLYCLQVRKSMGIAPYSQALEGLGVAWTMLGKVADARFAFEEALAEYVPIQSNPTSQAGILRSQFFLKRLTGPNLQPTKEERQALDGWYNQNHLEKVLTSYSPNQT